MNKNEAFSRVLIDGLLAVVEAKRYSIYPAEAAEQAKGYANQLKLN